MYIRIHEFVAFSKFSKNDFRGWDREVLAIFTQKVRVNSHVLFPKTVLKQSSHRSRMTIISVIFLDFHCVHICLEYFYV